MSAHILDGKILSQKIKDELKVTVASLKHSHGKHPRIVSIVVGDDAASQSYVLSQQRCAESLGIHYELQKFPSDAKAGDILALIGQLNAYTDVHGIMVNKPLPAQMDFKELIDAISPQKDVEGLGVANYGRLLLGTSKLLPCTPAAVMALIRSLRVDISAKEAVVLGRSEIVGKPCALLLLSSHATVTVCHSKTIDLPAHLKRADIVVAAVGQKHFVQGDWIKPGAIIIDVGINDDNGKVAGDVDFESCARKASFITPVPGGVGPVTSVMLMNNVVEAFKCQIS